MVVDKEEGGFSPSDQFGQPEHLIAEVYRSVVALYLRLPACEHVKSANKCFTKKFKQMHAPMASYSQSLVKGHSLATHSPGSCPLVNASEGQKKF